MKPLHIRYYYRRHAIIIDALACIALPVIIIIAITLCIIHGPAIDNFYPK